MEWTPEHHGFKIDKPEATTAEIEAIMSEAILVLLEDQKRPPVGHEVRVQAATDGP